ncbi:MAG TPA: hypothetical protein VKB95_01050, partial [Chitinophagaceae bacterium]|nr:hypothetical protein [Chitinophagaceae bacterium]
MTTHSKIRVLLVSVCFIGLLIIFTIYHANNFLNYSAKKGDEYITYLEVLLLLTYIYYFTLL